MREQAKETETERDRKRQKETETETETERPIAYMSFLNIVFNKVKVGSGNF